MYLKRMMCRLVLLLSGSNLLLLGASADACDNPSGEGFWCNPPDGVGHQSLCLPLSSKCDFKDDCANETDEEGCGFECDFDDVFMTLSSDDLVEEFCSGWTMPLVDRNLTGFTVTNGNQSFDDTTTRGGPPKDYSLRTRHGHYALFMGDIQEELREAELVSPWFESSPTILHLEFAMNMYGDGERELGVFLRRFDKPEVRLWTAYGDKGTSWIYHSIPLGKISTQFQILFQAIRESGDIGHIALDSISLRSADHVDDLLDVEVGSCASDRFRCGTELCISRSLVCDMEADCLDGEDEANETCSALPSPLRCDFEAGTCGWRNTGNSGIIWKRMGDTGSKDEPDCDHTPATSEGHYIRVESEGEAMGNNAIYESPLLVPPPREHYNESSELYNMCQLRFYYYMRGAHVSGLFIHLKERPRGCRGCGRNHKWVLQHSGLYGTNAWLRFSAPLPILSHRFVIQLEAIKVLPYSGAVAIDDISMTTECSNPTFESQQQTRELVRPDPIVEHSNKTLKFKFTACGMKGRNGPTQHQCDLFYGQKVAPVRVLSQGGVSGVQVWTIPESGSYTVTALGAAGGTGVYNTERGLGAYASARFTFNASDLLYVIVGQQGTDACASADKSVSEDMTYFCRQGRFSTNRSIEMAATDGATNVSGGGGGGATYVFTKNSRTGVIVPLLVAGGAGGKSGAFGLNRVRSDGGLSGPGPGRSSPSKKLGPGAGGGIRPTLRPPSSSQSGRSLLEDSQGGSPCPLVLGFGWETIGGFGGGGGGCLAGGGGGGYTGGNVSISGGSDHNGQGGSSYISSEGSNPRFDAGVNDGDGMVEVSFAFDCPCEFLCVYIDLRRNEVSCYCPLNKVLAEDGLSCIEKTGVQPSHSGASETPSIFIRPGAISAVAIASFAFVALLLTCAIYLIFHHRRQRLKAERLLRLSNPECCVSQLRSLTGIQVGVVGVGGGGGGVVGAQGIVTEYNPTYDFGETKCTIQDLKELARDRLVLVRALGQGAFGEVYQGYLSTRESGTIAVAAKTLPALCTSQAEMDFLMEAFIMSKFSHPNIVQFLGVCFDKHPKLIVLELLNGGDVKTFLRESRPTHEHPSTLTYLDLIRLSLDVAYGCEYLELNHFIHRDVAARNCLLTTKGPERVAKIADFGMARDIYRADYYRKGGKVMLPVKWMPPEAYLDGIFTSKTDVWSFGVLLWEVFSLGYMPYPGRGNQEVMELVTAGGRLEAPNSCPQPIYDLMVCCWMTDADQRPGFRHVIDKLKRCLEDPKVINAKLPVFHYSKSLTAADDTPSRQRWRDSRPHQSLHSRPTYPMEPSDDSNEPLTVSQFDEAFPNNPNSQLMCETET